MTKLKAPNGQIIDVPEGQAVSLLNGSNARWEVAEGDTDPRTGDATLIEDAEKRAQFQADVEKPKPILEAEGRSVNPNYVPTKRDDTPAPADAPEFPDPTGDADPDAEEPAGNASREDWVAYAATQGYDEADLERWSRNDIRDHLTA